MSVELDATAPAPATDALGATLGASTAAPRVDATATAAGRRHDVGARRSDLRRFEQVKKVNREGAAVVLGHGR